MPSKTNTTKETTANGAKAPPKKERRQVHERVFSHMRRGLMIGAFLPGQSMSLRKLAERFGTSPMPVREVLSRLVTANALEEMPSGSVRVPRLDSEKLEDLFGVRELVEGAAAERAAGKATPELIATLHDINNRLIETIEKRDILGSLSLNQEFHFTLYQAAGSDVLMPMIESLWLQFGPTMYMSLLIPSVPWNAEDHERILTALEKGSATEVKKGIVHDIRTTRDALLSVSSEQGLAELPFVSSAEFSMNY